MRTDDLDFDLPPELIAQTPPPSRTDARLLHYQRVIESISHPKITDLPQLFHPGDLLVFNDARVIPARFWLRKKSGGAIEALFLSEESLGIWLVMLRNLGTTAPGIELTFDADDFLRAQIEQNLTGGEFRLRIFHTGNPAAPSAIEVLEHLGRMPLPPYIKRDKQVDARDTLDRQRYQTIFATVPGAVAAPTAGLHFSPELLNQLDAVGVYRTTVTLHVGIGTFKPVTVDNLSDHPMHAERYTISESAADALNAAKQDARRIVAIGTTVARVLESQPANEPFVAKTDETRLFLYPPKQLHHIGALLTNFHLPRSTLIALVAAMIGLTQQRRIYREAIAEKYRFFSYGDAMLIE